MKKYLLMSSFVAAVLLLAAENPNLPKRPMKAILTPKVTKVMVSNRGNRTNASRANGGLSKQEIASAGNALTVLDAACNQLFADDSIGTVTFIHRNDQTVGSNGGNVGMYRYAVSTSGGATWNMNYGVLNPSNDNGAAGLNARFPQALIHRQAGNLTATDADLIYNGTWHNGTDWMGSCRGEAKLSGNASSFTEAYDTLNGQHVSVGRNLCNVGNTGVYYNLYLDYYRPNGFDASSTFSTGLVLQKGVWNSGTNRVDWTSQFISVPNDTLMFDDGSGTIFTQNSLAGASTAMAFDPTGTYGYIAFTADITVGDANRIDYINFIKTSDGGNTWSSPIEIRPDSLPGIYQIGTVVSQTGDTIYTGKSTVGDIDMAVDNAGRMHLGVILDERSIETTGNYYPNLPMVLCDIIYDPSMPSGTLNGLSVMPLEDVYAYGGKYLSNSTATVDEYNRLQMSRSADGTKLFFIYNDSDSTVAAAHDPNSPESRNESPDLLGLQYDVATNVYSDLVNFTTGDADFGGATATTAAGTFGGALYHTVSPIAIKTCGSYYIPVVLTQLDYNNTGASKSSEEPARFFYCNSITFANTTFTINGGDSVCIPVGGTYNELGATYIDATGGSVTPTVSSNVNTAVAGVYSVVYTACSQVKTKTVLVGNKPVSVFTPTQLYGNSYKFTDASTNNPTSWQWTFGDGTGSTLRNPTHNYTTASGVYTVKLCVSNCYGSSCDSQQVLVTLGINELDATQTITAFPNPTSGRLHIASDNFKNEDVQIAVYNTLGELVVAKHTIHANTGLSAVIDLNDVNTGMYTLKVESAKGNYVKNISVQR